MITKMADKKGLNRKKFGPNLRLLETDFFRQLNTKKNSFNMLCAIVILIFCYFFFLYLLVLYVDFSVKPLNFAPKLSIYYFSLFSWPFLLP